MANARFADASQEPATTHNLDGQAARAAMISLPPSFVIAFRYATSTGSFTSFVAHVALVGLVLSVAVLLLVMSIMHGFERELTGRLLAVAPHASLHFSEPVRDWDAAEASVEDHPMVLSQSGVVRGAGILSSEQSLAGVSLVGVDPGSYGEVSSVYQHIQGSAASFDQLGSGSFGAFLGARLAEKLRVRPGDHLQLMLSQALATPFGVVPRSKRITVLGTISSGTELDTSWMWLHRNDAAALLRGTPGSHALDLKVSDIMLADLIASELSTNINALADSWKRRFGPLYQGVISTRGVMFILLSLLIGVAAFNLVSALVMVVNQRRPDLAILRTMGASGRSTMSIAAWLGLFIGVFGTLLGLGLGHLLSLLAPGFYQWLDSSLELDLMGRYFISYLPTAPQLDEFVRVGAVTIGLCLVATLYPALRALRLQPAEVLSNE